MYKRYLIRLTPIDTYFFGGENTFNEGTSQNYYVKSNLLPQVSTLLGTLRYEVLRQNNKLSYDSSDNDVRKSVEKLIGKKGFCMDETISTYGIIQSLSPLFIENRTEKTFYTPLPLDEDIQVHNDSSFRCSISSSLTVNGMSAPNYNPKKYENYLYWTDNNKNRLKLNDIFYEKEQVGITKNGKDKNGEDGYYKVIYYGLKPGYNFIFSVTTSVNPHEDIIDLQPGTSFVYMGGNRSVFKMEIEAYSSDEKEEITANDASDYFINYFSRLHRDGRLLLLGDAFLTDQERELIPFYWAVSKENRYIITEYNKYNKKNNWNKPNKTDVLFHLLSRGGVIYPQKEIKNHNFLTCVGLNIFV